MTFPSSSPTQPNLWLSDYQCCFSEILGCFNPSHWRGDVWMLCWLITADLSHEIFHPQLLWAIFSMCNHSHALPTPNLAFSSPSSAGFNAWHAACAPHPTLNSGWTCAKCWQLWEPSRQNALCEIKITVICWADVELFILLGIFSNHLVIILVVFIAYILRTQLCEWMKDCLPPISLYKQPGALSPLNIYPEVGWVCVGRGEKLWKQKKLLPKISFEDFY